jgi:RNA polymerase sigma-70 factor (ECF subfamily)
MTDWLSTMAEARERFMVLVSEVRPDLHRYCTRMTGSVFDGEDVVQETLAKAYYALAEMETLPALRPWLFRIAHNAALDYLRRYEHRHVDSVADLELVAGMNAASEPEERGPDGERVEAALSVFAALPPVQRSALALKDVLGLSLEETAATMEISVAAVKGALVRARANVAATGAPGAPRTAVGDMARLRRYAELFNARDWEALRALFAEETKLDVVSRVHRRGRAASQYFDRYAEVASTEDLRAEAGWVAGVAVLAIYRPASSPLPAYFVQLDWRDGRVLHVRDFRYVPYIVAEAEFEPAPHSLGLGE